MKSYGSWLCPVCKTATANQQRFEQMVDVTLYRHPECGHVLSWRSGGVDWLEPYLVDQMQEGLRPIPTIRSRKPVRVPLEPYNPADDPPKRTPRQP